MKTSQDNTGAAPERATAGNGLEESAFAMPHGMYHLIYDGGWRCEFVNDYCLDMLGCTREGFLEALRSGAVFTGGRETPVAGILEELSSAPGQRLYTGAVRHGSGSIRHIKSALISVVGQGGAMQLYGQVADITESYEHIRIHSLERAGLLQVARTVFPEIISVNLTKGVYRMIQYYSATTLGTPPEGPLDHMLGLRLSNVAPEDQFAFKDAFFQEGLTRAIAQGIDRVQLTYRRIGQDGIWHWLETTAVRQENPYDDDVLMIAVSRSVDNEKERETMLRQALADTSQQFEDWLYYNGLSKRTYPGVTYIEYLDGRSSPYVIGRLADVLQCHPRELATGTCPRICPEDREAILPIKEEAERTCAEAYHIEYRVMGASGKTTWVSNRAFRFTDKAGSPGYIHFVTDTTEEHALTEQLRLHMEEQLAESEKIFNMVAQHSDRTLYAYDLKTGTTRPWDTENQKKDILAHMYDGVYSDGALDFNKFVLPDCMADVKRFFGGIHGGQPAGEANVHIQLLDGQRRWYHFKYTTIFDGGQPATALISIQDVTERHEHELAYRRYAQSLELDADGHLMYIESDLTANRIEKLAGQLLPKEERNIQCSHSDFGRLMLDLKFRYENPEESSRYFSCENLLGLYAQNIRNHRTEWQVRFPDGSLRWLDTETVLMADPYNGNVKAFFRMMDITEAHEERLSVMRRAEHDTMTGLLRKAAGEDKIRAHLAQNDEKGGILIALDLDDLKGINDTMGHNAGDQAIRGIANALKGHFRRDDILLRSGGDEFIVYLPGAGNGVSSVKLSMTALLRKLSGIAIGENGERYIHCSAGCAVVQPGQDTYESLFRRADLALYHVKRHGKNNFAFFDPDMLQEDYQFKITQAAPVVSEAARDEDLHHLLKVAAAAYPGIILFNLTQNRFRMLSVGSNAENLPQPGPIEQFWRDAANNIHPDDRQAALEALSRDGLLALYGQGQRRARHHYRNLENGPSPSTEVTASLYTTSVGDICAFLFFRWGAPEGERDVLRLQKILELSTKEDFEYVCVIDVRDRTYSTFSRDGRNSHAIPEAADFDTVTKHIQDTQIAPEDQEAYFAGASLDNVLARMRGPDAGYSYRYTTMDGITREVLFSWYEDSHSELLMIVKQVQGGTDNGL